MPYVGGFAGYAKHCAAMVANGYEGFVLSP
jgi:hypothetical protein